MAHVFWNRVPNDPSWSSKVVDSGTNRKRVWDFLLVLNCRILAILDLLYAESHFVWHFVAVEFLEEGAVDWQAVLRDGCIVAQSWVVFCSIPFILYIVEVFDFTVVPTRLVARVFMRVFLRSRLKDVALPQPVWSSSSPAMRNDARRVAQRQTMTLSGWRLAPLILTHHVSK